MRLLEHIDFLLESARAAGVPDFVADIIEAKVNYRKAQRYVAQWMKEDSILIGSSAAHKIVVSLFEKDLSSGSEPDWKIIGDAMGFFHPRSKHRADSEDAVGVMGSLQDYIAKEVRTNGDFFDLFKKLKKQRGIDDRKIDDAWSQDLSNVMQNFFGRHNDVINFLNANRNNVDKVSGLDVKDAKKVAAADRARLMLDPKNIVHEFSDGYYWYHVDSPEACEIEGERMQHCGSVGAGKEMYSLRDKHDNPRVTAEIDSSERTISQIKGKQNEAPDKKYWKYLNTLVDLVPGNEVRFTDFTYGYYEENEEFYDYMFSIPGIVNPAKQMREEMEKLSESLDALAEPGVEPGKLELGEDKTRFWVDYYELRIPPTYDFVDLGMIDYPRSEFRRLYDHLEYFRDIEVMDADGSDGELFLSIKFSGPPVGPELGIEDLKGDIYMLIEDGRDLMEEHLRKVL